MRFPAHAKVNLCLSVKHPPKDGYHELKSVFQRLDLHDDIHIRIEKSPEACDAKTFLGTSVSIDSASRGLAPESDLIFKALDRAEAAFGMPAAGRDECIRIDVEKRIPQGGGLGGGSSDAAAMLMAYADLTGLDRHDAGLVEVARGLGADVAFFMTEADCALMGGRGDVLEAVLPPMQAPLVLMGSDEGLSTALVYGLFDEDPLDAPDADALAYALADDPHDIERIASLCANNLGPVACTQDPRIAARLEFASGFPGVLNEMVSGSGATSFAICVDEAAADAFSQAVAPLCGWEHVSGIRPFVS